MIVSLAQQQQAAEQRAADRLAANKRAGKRRGAKKAARNYWARKESKEPELENVAPDGEKQKGVIEGEKGAINNNESEAEKQHTSTASTEPATSQARKVPAYNPAAKKRKKQLGINQRDWNGNIGTGSAYNYGNAFDDTKAAPVMTTSKGPISQDKSAEPEQSSHL